MDDKSTAALLIGLVVIGVVLAIGLVLTVGAAAPATAATKESITLSVQSPVYIAESFTVAVKDHNGNLKSGASVTYAGERKITGADGKADFVAKSDQLVEATAPGTRATLRDTALVNAQLHSLEIMAPEDLNIGQTAIVEVKDERGASVAGATVRVFNQASNELKETKLTDSEGKVAVKVDENKKLKAEKTGYKDDIGFIRAELPAECSDLCSQDQLAHLLHKGTLAAEMTVDGIPAVIKVEEAGKALAIRNKETGELLAEKRIALPRNPSTITLAAGAQNVAAALVETKQGKKVVVLTVTAAPAAPAAPAYALNQVLDIAAPAGITSIGISGTLTSWIATVTTPTGTLQASPARPTWNPDGGGPTINAALAPGDYVTKMETSMDGASLIGVTKDGQVFRAEKDADDNIKCIIVDLRPAPEEPAKRAYFKNAYELVSTEKSLTVYQKPTYVHDAVENKCKPVNIEPVCSFNCAKPLEEKTEPVLCTTDYAPVICNDGNCYGNDCEAKYWYGAVGCHPATLEECSG